MFIHLSFTSGANPYVYYGTSAKCKKELKRWEKYYNVIHLYDSYYELIEKVRLQDDGKF